MSMPAPLTPSSPSEERSPLEEPRAPRRSDDMKEWDRVDEASWQSFPASDSPAHSVGTSVSARSDRHATPDLRWERAFSLRRAL